MGVDPNQFAEKIMLLGVAALGINCGKSLKDNLEALKKLSQVTYLPIWFKPNAGLPKVDAEGDYNYDVTPEEMAGHVSEWIENGAHIIGGCCGTTPQHLKAIHDALIAQNFSLIQEKLISDPQPKAVFSSEIFRSYGDLILSPMDGFTDQPFRAICREMGSAVSYTEFINVLDIVRQNCFHISASEFHLLKRSDQ